MSEHLYLITILLPIAALLIIFGMKYWSAVAQARARLANEEAYRGLAEKVATAEVETAASLGAIRADVARLATSLRSVETILKQVE